MNQSDIKKYYKTFGYINLIISILFLIFYTEIALKERLIGAVGINIFYHIPYSFFTSIPHHFAIKKNINNRLIDKVMLKLFSIFGIIGSLLLMYVSIFNAISLMELQRFLVLSVSFGLFFGAYYLWLHLKSE